jgi:CheY-like chemotaxis protein
VADSDARRPTILLVDDNADILESYAEILRGNGLEPITAATGESALELAFRLRPDAIVIDIWMPGMDGFDTARALRADERTRGTPLIAFTSLGFSRRKAEEAGCNAIVRKTGSPEALVAAVWKVLRPKA